MKPSLLSRLLNPNLVALPLVPGMWLWWSLENRRRTTARSSGPSEVKGIDRIPLADLPGFIRAQRPAVVTDVATKWRALTAWTPEYLKEKFGDVAFNVFRTDADDPNFLEAYKNGQRERMAARELIERCFSKEPGGKRYYSYGQPGWDELSSRFNGDFWIPHLDNREFSTSGTGVWIGQAGNVTALHYDNWHGLLAQIRGRKAVTLFDPREGFKLAPGHPFGNSKCESTLPRSGGSDTSGFRRIEGASRYEHVLSPGEVLYIPLFWWHEVVSLDAGISIALRYNPHIHEVLVNPAGLPAVFQATLEPVLNGGAEIR